MWHATPGPGVTEWQAGLGQPACGAQSNLNLSPEAARLHSVDSETGDWSVRSRRLPESLPPRLGLRGAARAALGTGTGSGKDPAVAPRDRTVTPGAPPSLPLALSVRGSTVTGPSTLAGSLGPACLGVTVADLPVPVSARLNTGSSLSGATLPY